MLDANKCEAMDKPHLAACVFLFINAHPELKKYPSVKKMYAQVQKMLWNDEPIILDGLRRSQNVGLTKKVS